MTTFLPELTALRRTSRVGVNVVTIPVTVVSPLPEKNTVRKAVGALTLPRNFDVFLYLLDQLLTTDHQCHRVPSAATSEALCEFSAAPKCRSKNLIITLNASFDSGTSAL